MAVCAVVRDVVQLVRLCPACSTCSSRQFTAPSVLLDDTERLVLLVRYVVIFPARLVRFASKLLEELLSQRELFRRVVSTAAFETDPFPPSLTVIEELMEARALSTLVDEVLLLFELLTLVVIAAFVLVRAVSTLVDEVTAELRSPTRVLLSVVQ
jgi:hypothetical protein